MSAGVIGRRDELDAITTVLDDVKSSSRGRIVELTGDAGIGKSTVFAAAVAAARDAGWRVLLANPTAAESGFPWTGLGQLLDGVQQAQLDALVPAHVTQLLAATSATRTEPVSPELVAFGLAALFDSAADDGPPLLVAVDDAQWLDRPSAGALSYALRRTPKRRSVALLSSRVGEPSPIEASRVVGTDEHVRIQLDGLSLAALRQVIATATGRVFGLADVARVHQRTAGNPLYAIEIAREAGDGVPLDAAALPPSLRDTIGRRVRQLPPETRRVLGAAALSARPTLPLLQALLTDVDVLAALAPAEAADVVAVRQGAAGAAGVGFSHPLLASAAIDAMTTAERRMAHAALAAVVDDAVERATHLVELADAPDEARAAELDAAAREARSRGATDAALAFARAAVAATPDRAGIAYVGRLHHRLELEHALGEFAALKTTATTLRTLAEQVIAEESGDEAATARQLLDEAAPVEAVAVALTEGMAAGAAAAERVLDEVRDPRARLMLHQKMAIFTGTENMARGLEIAQRVLGPGSEHEGVFGLLAAAMLAQIRVYAGVAADVDELLACTTSGDLNDADRHWVLGYVEESLRYTEHPRSVDVARLLLTHFDSTGQRREFVGLLTMLVPCLLVRGDWQGAEQALLQVSEYSAENVNPAEPDAHHGLILAGRGDAEAARASIERALSHRDLAYERAQRMYIGMRASQVAHTLGDPAAADALLDVERVARDLGFHGLRVLPFRRDLVEALVAAGRLDEATAALERLDAIARRSQVAAGLADADAAAGVVTAVRGDWDTAATHFTDAIATQRELGLNYELARTQLAAGAAARRAGKRAYARAELAAAAELFDAMGAALWAQRCTDELARLGTRTARGSATELTATEAHVAELVAAGQTNPEIAAALFVSRRTVEAHLTSIYRKLGIRSRVELAARR